MRWAVAGALLLLSPSALAAQRTENVVLIEIGRAHV